MTYTLDLKKAYLGLPVKTGREKALLEIFVDEEKKYELMVPALRDEPCDYYCWMRLMEVSPCRASAAEITLRGELPEAFFEQIRQTDEVSYEPLPRPLLHFTAERGWLNDPNGLVYRDGIYHLYFQYNPVDTEWGNMSWGHAVSRDLLNFRQTDTVLFPDETGTVFSGSGLAVKRGLLEPGQRVETSAVKDTEETALVFFYTAAGGTNPWSRERQAMCAKGNLRPGSAESTVKNAFTQRMAVSTDGGRTLQKLPKEIVGVLGSDSRDPQVFRHEDSGAYVMVLWIQGEEIALLRSADLLSWEQSDRFSLPGAYECPNLFCLPTRDGEYWILMFADGTWYIGTFDGWRFQTDGISGNCYLNRLAYAAQVYSGIKDRTVMIPWLRTKNAGRLYTGAMGLPRELSLDVRKGNFVLQMRPVREYEAAKRRLVSCEVADDVVFEITEAAVTELAFSRVGEQTLTIDFFGQTLIVEKEAILFGGERTVLPEALREFHLLIDRQIIELYGNNYTQSAYYETGSDTLTGTVRVADCPGVLEVYQWKPS